MESHADTDYLIRNTLPSDVDALVEISDEAYPLAGGWGTGQFRSQIETFPEGQFAVVEKSTGLVVGMAASLIVDYSQFTLRTKWKEITDWGHFDKHDPVRGKTLYGAEIMVRPSHQGRGIGKLIYREREDLARRLRLLNIRAGARISGYHACSNTMSAREYALAVVRGELSDPTLSFQLKRGFRAIGLTPNYFYDPESDHYAVVIEWLNPEIARDEDWEQGDPEFLAAARDGAA